MGVRQAFRSELRLKQRRQQQLACSETKSGPAWRQCGKGGKAQAKFRDVQEGP